MSEESNELPSCEFCEPTIKHKKEFCGDVGPFSFYCTREVGHAGPHVSCGTIDHQLTTWPNLGEVSNGQA